MRTTVTLDDDVAQLLNVQTERTRQTFDETVNNAIRAGLRKSPTSAKRRRFSVKAKPMKLKAGIDVSHLNQLADELEVAEFAKPVSRRRP